MTGEQCFIAVSNTSDCEALQLVAHCVSKICSQISTSAPIEDSNFVDTNKLRGWGPFKFGQLNCAIPDFEYINRASYWNYQRERIVFRSPRLRKRIRMRRSRRRIKCPANKVIVRRRTIVCPYCKSREVYKWGPRSKTVYDLKFSPAGVKRWVVNYQFDRHKCWQCKKTFMPQRTPWTRSKYGDGLIRSVVFLTIDLQISQQAAAKLIRQFFGLDLAGESVGRFKKTAAAFYEGTYKQIVRTIVEGPLAHVDETKASLNGRSAYVWVLANQENVAYFVSESREGAKVHAILKKFKGILVSDFYSLYDSFGCPQQKCLIHLMRDLNDDLLREPFNEELKSLVTGFGSLVKLIVETVDRYGLRCRFMKKHKRSVVRFYRWLRRTNFETEVGASYKKRFEKNREKLFTFLDYDDVPWNNNAAEHAIKAFATLRRVFGGRSNEAAVQDYLVLLSVCETCRYRGINFWEFLCSGYKDVNAYVKSQRGHRRRNAQSYTLRTKSSDHFAKRLQSPMAI
jgi:Transposase IS66 family